MNAPPAPPRPSIEMADVGVVNMLVEDNVNEIFPAVTTGAAAAPGSISTLKIERVDLFAAAAVVDVFNSAPIDFVPLDAPDDPDNPNVRCLGCTMDACTWQPWIPLNTPECIYSDCAFQMYSLHRNLCYMAPQH
jgi:hypothetical protein